jgi:hypothetical protein
MKTVAYTRAGLMALAHKDRSAAKPQPKGNETENRFSSSKVSEPHLFPPPRRAGEDEGGGTVNLGNASSLESVSTKGTIGDLWQQLKDQRPRNRW